MYTRPVAAKSNITKLGGIVTAFSGNGRSLGYPTANLTASTSLKDGVYFGFADLGTYQDNPALIFIGVPTTVGDAERRIEAHLLDIPDKDYYGLHLNLRIYKFLRPNKKFDSVSELIAAIRKDEVAAHKWFKLHKLA